MGILASLGVDSIWRKPLVAICVPAVFGSALQPDIISFNHIVQPNVYAEKLRIKL